MGTYATIEFTTDTGSSWDTVWSVLDQWYCTLHLSDGTTLEGIVSGEGSERESRAREADLLVIGGRTVDIATITRIIVE